MGNEESMMNLKVDHLEILGADTLVYGHFGEDKTSLTVRLPDIHHFQRNTVLPLAVSSAKLHLFIIRHQMNMRFSAVLGPTDEPVPAADMPRR